MTLYMQQLEKRYPCETNDLFSSPHPDVVKLWLDQLPKANLIRSALAIYYSLKEQHDTHLEPTLWYDSLQALDESATYFSTMLHKKYLEDSALLSHEKRQVMALAQALLAEMASHYHQLAAKHHTAFKGEQLVLILSRSFSIISMYFLRSFQLYNVPNTELISVAYQLYLFSEERGLSKTFFTPASSSHSQATSLLKQFKMILLLLSLSPYQLTPHDLEHVYEHLSEWADLIILNETLSGDDLFLVDLQSNKAPEYSKLHDQLNQTGILRSLNYVALIDKLNELLSFTKHGEKHKTSNLTEFVLHHLIRTWGSFPSRQFTRTQESGEVNACIGLVSAHYFLNDEQDDIPEPRKADEEIVPFTNIDRGDLDLLPNNYSASPDDLYSGHSQELQDEKDPWKLIYKRQDAHHIPEPKPTKIHKPQFHNWELVNSSSNGYCLCTSASYPDELKAGKIIGLQEQVDDNKCYWQIGVLRWIKYTDDNQLQVGIELISPNAIPIGIQTKEQERAHYKLIRALLLPDIPALQQPQTLIVPRLPFKDGMIVRIANMHIDADVKLIENLNYSNFFNRYSFEIVEQHYDAWGDDAPEQG